MINEQAMESIRELEEEYKYRWGKDVDYTLLPPRITQEKLVVILEHIVETGQGIMSGWEEVKEWF